MPDGKGFIALCEDAGNLVEIIRNDFRFPVSTLGGFVDVVDKEDRDKFNRFVSTVLSRHVAFDWVINATLDGRVEKLHFGAAYIEGQIVVIAAENRTGLVRLIEELASGPTDSIAQSRLVFQESGRQLQIREGQDTHLFDELTRLNNELATTQRQLIKSNFQLSRANEELRAFYDTLPLGVFRTDVMGAMVEVNRQCTALIGGPGSEDWFNRIHPDDLGRVQSCWRTSIKEASSFESRHRQVNADHVLTHLHVRAVPLRDKKEGGLTGFVGVVEDVSVQVHAEEQVREIERQKALHEFTGGLAHNLNNIMAVVLGSVESLQAKLASGHPAQVSAQMIGKASQRAATLTRRLMIYAGLGIIQDGPMDVDAELVSMWDDIKRTLPENREVVLSTHATGAKVEADRSLFRETISELIVNANSFIPEDGTIRVATRIEAGERPKGRCFVSIEVSDNGIGMDAESLRRAKEPFFTMRDIGQGVGLGLSLADGFARIAGGFMEIESQVGRGTRVRLRLPMARTELPDFPAYSF